MAAEWDDEPTWPRSVLDRPLPPLVPEDPDLEGAALRAFEEPKTPVIDIENIVKKARSKR